jgi:hypothetical protein
MNAVVAAAPAMTYAQAYKSVGNDVHTAYAAFGDQISNGAWGVARVCLATIRAGCPAMYAYQIAAADSGLGQRTVRMYCQVLTDFDDATIEDYSSAGFGITHFTAALQSPDPLAALAWARESADSWGGKIASVDQILARWVLPQDPPAPQEPPQRGLVGGWLGLLRNAGNALSGDSRALLDQGLALVARAFGYD